MHTVLNSAARVLTLSSVQITFLVSPRMMNNIDGLGGIIVLAKGLNLL